MSVSTVVTATGTVTSNVAVLFGLTVSASAAAADPAPTDVATVTVYDGTSTSGTKVAEMVLMAGSAATPPPVAASEHITFPAGIRCSSGIHVVVTGNGHTVAVTVDHA